MGELSVFVDESGDFGALAAHCPFYIVSLVVHDQDEPIDAQLGRLEKVMRESGFDRYGPVHTAPLIRREAPYAELDGRQRRRMLMRSSRLAVAVPSDIKSFSLISAGSGTAMPWRSASLES